MHGTPKAAISGACETGSGGEDWEGPDEDVEGSDEDVDEVGAGIKDTASKTRGMCDIDDGEQHSTSWF